MTRAATLLDQGAAGHLVEESLAGFEHQLVGRGPRRSSARTQVLGVAVVLLLPLLESLLVLLLGLRSLVLLEHVRPFRRRVVQRYSRTVVAQRAPQRGGRPDQRGGRPDRAEFRALVTADPSCRRSTSWRDFQNNLDQIFELEYYDHDASLVPLESPGPGGAGVPVREADAPLRGGPDAAPAGQAGERPPQLRLPVRRGRCAGEAGLYQGDRHGARGKRPERTVYEITDEGPGR